MNLHQFLKSLSSFPRISVFRHWFLFVLEVFPSNFTTTNVQQSLKSPLIKKYKKILEEKVIQLSSLVEINWKSKDFTISNEAISILWRVYFDRSGNSVSPILYRSILSLLLVFFFEDPRRRFHGKTRVCAGVEESSLSGSSIYPRW